MPGSRTALSAVASVLSLAALSAAPALALELAVVTDGSFEAEVLRKSQVTPVAVFFVASWCGPCRVMTPALQQVAEEYDGRVVFATLDIDQSLTAPSTYGVASLPTTILFKGGQAVDRKVGALSKDMLVAWIGPHAR